MLWLLYRLHHSAPRQQNGLFLQHLFSLGKFRMLFLILIEAVGIDTREKTSFSVAAAQCKNLFEFPDYFIRHYCWSSYISHT